MNLQTAFSGKTALITGAAKRLGRSIALALASQGCNIVIHYGESASEAEETASAIRQAGSSAWTLQANLQNPAEVDSIMPRAGELCGEINCLINNASIFPTDTLATFTPEGLALNMQINALAPLQLMRAFAANKPSDSCIVNLIDCRITDYDSQHVAYHLSKKVLYDLTRMAALEFAPAIRVNAVAPGLILPPAGQDESYLAKYSLANPLQAVGSADDVADAVLYLLQARYVTGQVIYVDGGRNMKGCVYGN